MLIEID